MQGATQRYRSIVADSARWDGFRFRADDIVISTPAKSGTTWMQMICALLIVQETTFERPLAELSPWLDMLITDRDSVVTALEAQRHRRFIKTHTPLDGLPYDDRVTYVCVGRDPRDVALSWDNHMANLNIVAFLNAREAAVGLDDIADLLAAGLPVPLEDPAARFWQWVDDERPVSEVNSLHATLHHLQTFWDERSRDNVVLVHYADLKADLDSEMRRLAARLGISVPADRWPALVEAATFDNMRTRADELVPNSIHALWQDNNRFFHRGTSGQWHDLLDEDGLRRYHARVAELTTPDLAVWAHRA